MQRLGAGCIVAVALAVVGGGCSADEGDAGSTDPLSAPDGRGDGRLEIEGQGLIEFTTDTCFEGAGTDLSPDLRLHVEGRGVDAEGVDRIVQIVQTSSPTGEEIAVIRVRANDGPAGAAWEAQRVHDPATGDVNDLWGEGTTPLLEVSHEGSDLSVVARDAVFGEFPGGAGDTRVLGTGQLQVSCRVEGG